MIMDAVKEVILGGYEVRVGKSRIVKEDGVYIVKRKHPAFEKEFHDLDKALACFQKIEGIKG